MLLSDSVAPRLSDLPSNSFTRFQLSPYSQVRSPNWGGPTFLGMTPVFMSRVKIRHRYDLTTSILWPNYTLLILNRGGEICSLLHKGQRPGVLRRVRFLKEKPHRWQEAGSIAKPLWCTDFSICMRWSRTSFSLIPNNFEISLKSRESPSNASAIFFLKVDILSIFKLTSEFYQTLLIDWPNCSMT